MSMNVEKRIAQYIALRDRVKLIDEAYKNDRKKYTDLMDEIEGILQKFLDDNKLENLSTDAGTCYTTTRYTATLADPQLFMNYVIENSAWDLLDRKANSTAVKKFVAKNKTQPPGCNLTGLTSVGVRRGKSDKSNEGE